MMEREAIADRDPRLIAFRRWLKEDYVLPNGQPYNDSVVINYYQKVRRLFFDEDDIEDIERRAVCIWRHMKLANRNSSLEDQYNAIRRFVEFRGIGDEANDDHNEDDQRVFEDWLAENQHQREVQ
jgi:hypothetical protein